MNLSALPALAQRYGVPVGLSDHTLGETVAVAAVTLGARIVEKHFTLSRADGGPDAPFSMESMEFAHMVEAIRAAEKILGSPAIKPTQVEQENRLFRRSLFVVVDMKAGDIFTAETVRTIRPGHGLPPRTLHEVLGKRAARSITRGTPLSWDLIAP
jgi:sialic acid synthase SpsE